MSVNYEKLVDGNFVHEQMGIPKKKESFSAAIESIWKVINDKYGLMRIDFNEPFSLKELVRSFNERQNDLPSNIPRPIPSARKLLTGPSAMSTTSMFGIEVVDKHRVLVDNIARHLVFDSSLATSIMSTNVVAFLLLNKFRTGTTIKELSKTLNELRRQVGIEKEFSFGEEESESVIKRAVKLLGSGLVQEIHSGNEIVLKPVLSLPSVIETAYYSNTFVPYFALDAVICTSLATVNEGVQMSMNDVLDNAMFFCDILRYEFIFYKPCQDFPEQVEKSLVRLCKRGMLVRTEGEAVALNFNSSMTLLSCLAPFTLTYFSVVECLKELVGEAKTIVENDFVKLSLAYTRNKFETEKITYGESVSIDSVKNCVKLIEKWSVIEVHLNHGIRELGLSSQFNSLPGVQAIAEKIERFVILK